MPKLKHENVKGRLGNAKEVSPSLSQSHHSSERYGPVDVCICAYLLFDILPTVDQYYNLNFSMRIWINFSGVFP